ncbi:hypothetical protein [Streptomyces alkaliterrae]|uniref:DsrE family protein n=1 Tax=Streptomyces alkaliterrae TaxID=2213162 RepID=A0A5P0YLH6_9ACTN|nr:hypothetical protein [Streptomyces alkaliterrae]MBB1252750.1 hypothetical protein [Streptomyces alkaliterrae]MBB1258515.1 hypothetical protein [Streptomyces alkaliterrae]MQS00487.1 hypothetical protein [Streptomyces alkaliterrae]
MARKIPHSDVLVTLMGAPHESDRTTSALRLVQALLERGNSVAVWTCGYATLLTQRSLGTEKPRNLADWNTAYPSTTGLVQDLLDTFPERLRWYGCRFCSDDRGADDHLPSVVLRPPAGYAANFAAADRTLMVGVL